MSTFSKIKLAIAALTLLGFGLFYVGYVGQFSGEQTSKGSIESIDRVTNTLTKGGEKLSSYDAFSYAITIDSVDKSVIYEEPTVPNGQPMFAKGEHVKVTWRKRGLLGKPLVFSVVR
jgi:hypothetical protein